MTKRFGGFFVFFLLWAVSGLADEGGYAWENEKIRDGFRMSSSLTPGSSFRTYRAQGILEHSWEVLFEVLLDVESYPMWMPGCTKAAIVRMVNDDPVKGNFIIHLEWDAIWPVKNRDLVVEVRSDHDWANDHVSIVLCATDKVDVPVPEGKVRLRDFFARFDFRYVDQRRTEVTFMTLVDPGGAVPPALAKIQTAPVPFDTLKGLGQQAGDAKYRKKAVTDYY